MADLFNSLTDMIRLTLFCAVVVQVAFCSRTEIASDVISDVDIFWHHDIYGCCLDMGLRLLSIRRVLRLRLPESTNRPDHGLDELVFIYSSTFFTVSSDGKSLTLTHGFFVPGILMEFRCSLVNSWNFSGPGKNSWNIWSHLMLHSADGVTLQYISIVIFCTPDIAKLNSL